MTTAGQGAHGSLPAGATPDFSEVADWIALLKPRVMYLVVFAGLIGLLVAPATKIATIAQAPAAQIARVLAARAEKEAA